MQNCLNCNNPIHEDDMAQIELRDGHKVIVHSHCPEQRTARGKLEPKPNLKYSKPVSYKDVCFQVRIDQDGNYVICDDETGDDMDEKWEESDLSNPESCQTYSFTIKIPVPKNISVNHTVDAEETVEVEVSATF